MLSLELKDKIYQYIDSSITLEQLEDWIVAGLRNYLRHQETTDAGVVSIVELGLAEIANGIRSEDEFRSSLRSVLQDNVTDMAFYPSDSRTLTGSANETAHPLTVSFQMPQIVTFNES